MKTQSTTYSTHNEDIRCENFMLELLLKELQRKLQNAIQMEVDSQKERNIHAVSFAHGCQSAYKTAIDDIRNYLIVSKQEPEKSINP